MRRRSVLTALALTLVPGALARAQPGLAEIRIVGAPRDGRARFRLVNRTADALTYTTYDGGNVHNGLDRLEPSGAWSDVDLGYCGLGRDGVVVVPAGATRLFHAYVGSEPGTYRIRVHLSRGAAGAEVPEEIQSAPFRVP